MTMKLLEFVQVDDVVSDQFGANKLPEQIARGSNFSFCKE